MWKKKKILPTFQTKADPEAADESDSAGKRLPGNPELCSQATSHCTGEVHWTCVAATRKATEALLR